MRFIDRLYDNLWMLFVLTACGAPENELDGGCGSDGAACVSVRQDVGSMASAASTDARLASNVPNSQVGDDVDLGLEMARDLGGVYSGQSTDASALASADALTDATLLGSVDAAVSMPQVCRSASCPMVANGSSTCENGACVIRCLEGYRLQDNQCVDVDECAVDNGACGADTHYACENEIGGAPTCRPLFGTNRVLFIGLDGTRDSVLSSTMVQTPVIDELKTKGVYSGKAQCGDKSVSGPGWSNLLTGVWRDKHGVRNNTVSSNRYGEPPSYVNGRDYPDFLARLEQVNPQYVTAWVNGWSKLEYMAGADAADYHFYQDYEVNGDFDAVARAKAMLENHNIHAMFFYFAMIDIAGHEYGFHPTVDQYTAAIELVDLQLGQILDSLRRRAHYADENWLIVVATDHGGASDDFEGHGANAPYDRRVFIILSGDDVIERSEDGGQIYPHPHQVDVVPTIFNHLGVDIDPEWRLDGKPILGEGRRPPAEFGVNLIENPGAEVDRGFSTMDFDAPISGWEENYGGIPILYDTPNYPLSADHPSGGESFFAGGTDMTSTMTQRIDVSHLDLTEASQFMLSAELGGYRTQGDAASVNVRFLSGDASAAVRWDSDRVYFFKGARYWTYDVDRDSVVGLPRDIGMDWPGLEAFEGGAAQIDAAFADGDGKAYFFKGTEYIRYTINTRTADPGYPRPIGPDWEGLVHLENGPADLNAAVRYGGVVYFFKNKEYVRFDLDDNAADPRYPRDVSQLTWEGLHVWSGHIDAALRWTNDRLHFFNEGAYIRFDMDADRISSGYPKDITRQTWPNLSEWEARRRLVRLGPITADDRSERTMLLPQTMMGNIPPDTETIEIELFFSLETGDSDGYVDNLSLILTP